MTMGNNDAAILEVPEAHVAGKIKTKHVKRRKEALFHWCEMIVGELLGTGAFCDVHELLDVHLLDKKELAGMRNKCQTVEEQSEQRKRENLYRTCHDAMGKSRYVVKHLRFELAADRGVKVFNHAASDCLKEFDILSRLSHPNIVQLWGSAFSGRNGISNNDDDKRDSSKIAVDNNPETFFILLERVEETLSQRIRQWIFTQRRMAMEIDSRISDTETALPPFHAKKLLFALDIATALAHIHSHGMVFRDLKPDNIGIAQGGIAKLFDFGLCRTLPLQNDKASSCRNNAKREAVYRMTKVGTRRYMSPEMISGHGYNQKADCYCWAMVFYEMLSLQKPYAKYDRAAHKVLVCEKKGRPRISGVKIPWSSRDLLKKSWTHNFSDRPSMEEVCELLEPMIDTVEEQGLPLIERSLRAVSEMAKLLAFDDCGDRGDDYPPGNKNCFCSPQKSSCTETTSSMPDIISVAATE